MGDNEGDPQIIERAEKMKKFSFPLSKVLEYKQQIEDNLRTEHAGIVRSVIKKEEEIDALEERHRYFTGGLENTKKRGCKIEEIRVYEAYLDQSSRAIKEEKENLELLRQKEEEKRNEVIEAKKSRTSIDMLKEKKLREYNFTVQKEEERFIEEFVANNKYHA